jgi:hypothetical protein
MTKRRNAERAVIDCAKAYVDTPQHAVNYHVYRDSLTRAVHTLRALELEAPGETRTSKVAPVTSQMAAAYMHGARAESQAGWILRALYNRRFTTDELVTASGRPHQSISARVNELRDGGWICDSGDTRKTRSGQEATVWMLTPAAHQAMREGVTM